MLNYNQKLFSYNELFNDFISLDSLNKLPSRILLTGQEGIGKCTFALHFTNYMFSKNDANKYNSLKNIINTNNISYNHINNLTHPNFFLFINMKIRKILKLIK